MKKVFINLLILIIIGGVLFYYQKDLQKFFYSIIYKLEGQKISLEDKNQYFRDYDFKFVQNTDNFSPHSRDELINIFYTAINIGVDEFTFYCPNEYSNCLNDVEAIANDQNLLSDINNFVHPFNSFNHIATKYNSLGKVVIHIDKSYSPEQIAEISKKVDELSKTLIIPNDSDKNNIKRVHDYIINHAVYDADRSDYDIKNYQSDIAYGPLLEGYAICGGYTDAMELFLEKMGIKSYKISSAQHVWNAVYLDGKWLHLDLTWDDPVASSGENLLEHNFFLIDTPTLLNLEPTEHIFNQEIYSELKEA